MITNERIDKLVQMADHGRLDISVYTDQEIFEAELQRIFYRTWVYVGHSSEIAQAGDYKTTYIGRIPVIVSRDENGEIHVLINRCAHRGPTVCQQEYGNANFFRCEYHGWVYGNDGSLAGVSLRRGFGPGEIDDIQGGLDKAPRVDSYRGLIFASLSPDGPTLQEHLGLARQYLDDWSDLSPTGEVMLAGGTWKHTNLGNWKLVLEGSNEGYHPQYLHKVGRLVAEQVSLLRQKTQTDSAQVQAQGAHRNIGTNYSVSSAGIDLGNGHSVMGSIHNENAYKSLDPSYVASLTARLGEERMKRVVGATWRMQLFPNAAFAPSGNLRVIRPISVNKTEIMQWVILQPGLSDSATTRIIMNDQRGYGPAGFTSPDDLEMFARMFEGYRSTDQLGLNQWALFSRGLSTEKQGPNGERFGHVTTEVNQRAIYYAWAAMMKGEPHVTSVDPVNGDTADAARAAHMTLEGTSRSTA